ncbi:Ger(x)C family spore germination protein [Bacillus pinisoli]|uniref:Ger(x)C family spore germination protein n=1 Tax=Bacillus pinisoli TaxID=2901866 RepID=UPI001FF6C715|nr:Ger(x)C family spore germination protein [Bacillus pinisoli]
MKKSKIFTILILLTLLLSMTGCWSRNELTDLAIVSAMGIDIVDDEYLLTVQVLNPGEISGDSASSRLSVTTYETKGSNIFQAIRRLTKESANRLYFAHLRMVVIGEEAAKTGIGKMLELMSRDHEFRTDFYIVVAKDGKATDTLKILTAIEKNPANKIFTSLDVSHSHWAATLGTKLDKLISEITSKGDNPVLTGVVIEGDKEIGNSIKNVEMIESAASINIEHLSVFRGDKLIGWLDEDESKGHNYITDNVMGTVVVSNWGDGNIAFEIRETKTKVEAKVKDEKPAIQVYVTTEVGVGEVQASVDLLDEKTIEELEKKISDNKKHKIESAISKAKELETDIFGFGEVIHRKDPKLWASLEKTWNEEGFVNLDITVKVKSYIRRLGTTNESFINDIQSGS